VVGIAVEKSRSRGESPREGAVPDEDSFGCPRYYGGAASGLGGNIYECGRTVAYFGNLSIAASPITVNAAQSFGWGCCFIVSSMA
jgi:hypothetical protein